MQRKATASRTAPGFRLDTRTFGMPILHSANPSHDLTTFRPMRRCLPRSRLGRQLRTPKLLAIPIAVRFFRFLSAGMITISAPRRELSSPILQRISMLGGRLGGKLSPARCYLRLTQALMLGETRSMQRSLHGLDRTPMPSATLRRMQRWGLTLQHRIQHFTSMGHTRLPQGRPFSKLLSV